MLFNNLVFLRVWRVDKKGRCHLKQDAFWILLAFLSTEYGSIPIDTFLVGWTSINPSYFDVNYRGTIGFDTLPTEATTLLSKPSLPTDILSSVSEIYRPYLPWAYRWYVCPSPGQHLQMHWHLWIRMSMVPTILSMRPSLCLFTRLVQFCWVTIIIYYYYHLYLYMFVCIFIPVVPHKAVAEVSKIGHYRRGELLWCVDGKANPLILVGRKVFGVVFFWNGRNGCSGHLTHNCWMQGF